MTTATKLEPGKVYDLPLATIKPDPDQPRKHFDKEGLQLLADSIKGDGLIQPITVRQPNGQIIIVTGERRWRASQLAGVETIKAILDTNSDDAITRGLRQVAENEIREGLNHMELAEILVRMRTQEHKSDTEIQQALEKVGMENASRTGIANYIRLNELPDWAKDMIRAGTITGSHGKYLLMAKGLPQVEARLKASLKQQLNWKGLLTVHDVEDVVVQAMRHVGIQLDDTLRTDDSYMIESIARGETHYRKYRAFDVKVCQGCEFLKTVGKQKFCFNAAEFKKKNDAAIEQILEKRKAKGKRVADDKPLTSKQQEARDKENAQRTAASVKNGIEQYLETFLRKHLVALMPAQKREWLERLVLFTALGMPEGSGYCFYYGTDRRELSDTQGDARKKADRKKLADFLDPKRPVSIENLVTTAQACVLSMTRDDVHRTCVDRDVDLGPIFRITPEYLDLQRRQQLEQLAKAAKLTSIVGMTGKAIKTELLKKTSVETIGVPDAIVKLYKGPVSRETRKKKG